MKKRDNIVQRPATMKDTVDRIWEVVEGPNGGGLKALARRNEEHIAEIKTELTEVRETCAYIKGKMEGRHETYTTPTGEVRAMPSTKQITLKRLAEVGVVALVFGLVLGGAFLIAIDKVLPGDIAEILRAWKGVP